MDEELARSVELRPSGAGDEPFLYQVYASTRADEMAMVDWDQAAKDAFVSMQFNAQRKHYLTHYPDAEYLLILLDDVPVGRLYVTRDAREIHIIDIALLPAYRNRGIGGYLLRGLLDEARRDDKLVTIYVEQFNPAMSLYLRLGFSKVEESGIYILMRWAAASGASG